MSVTLLRHTIYMRYGGFILTILIGLTAYSASGETILPGMRPASLAGSGLKAPSGLPTPVITDLTNYPNPFDSRRVGAEGRTTIAYRLSEPAPVSLTLYDLLGHRVRSWRFQAGENGAAAGENRLNWDGTNEYGRKVAKGGYIAEIVIEAPHSAVTAIRKIGVIH